MFYNINMLFTKTSLKKLVIYDLHTFYQKQYNKKIYKLIQYDREKTSIKAFTTQLYLYSFRNSFK